MARLSEPNNYRSGPEPLAHTVLCAELPDDVGGPLWVADDASLAEQVSDELTRVGMGPLPVLRHHVIGHHVVRLPSVYPVYDLAYAGHQQVFTRWIAGTDGLVAVGRQALFAHDNTHHAMAMGHAAGELAVQGWDRNDWTASLRRFADHVVED